MRKRQSLTRFVTVAPRAIAIRGRFSLLAVLMLAGGLLLGSCGPAMTRPKVSEQDLLKFRTANDEEFVASGRKVFNRLIQRTKAEYDRYTAGGRKEPPVIDMLVISGGGDWGAFGGGSLRAGRRCLLGIRWPSPSSTL